MSRLTITVKIMAVDEFSKALTALRPALHQTAESFVKYNEAINSFNREWDKLFWVLNAKRNYRRSAWLLTGALLLLAIMTR